MVSAAAAPNISNLFIPSTRPRFFALAALAASCLPQGRSLSETAPNLRV
jgi:hypothetical protein